MAALQQRLGTAGPEPGTAAGTAGAASAEPGAKGAKGAVLSVELERPDFEQALREVSQSPHRSLPRCANGCMRVGGLTFPPPPSGYLYDCTRTNMRMLNENKNAF